MAFTKGGGARRQARQRLPAGMAEGCRERSTTASAASPQRTQAAASWGTTSDQQAAQIGANESCGRRYPQREHEAGKIVQASASRGLRSTRDTARHLEISDGVASNVSEPRSLRKTHLSREAVAITATHPQYTVGVKLEPISGSLEHSDRFPKRQWRREDSPPPLLTN